MIRNDCGLDSGGWAVRNEVDTWRATLHFGPEWIRQSVGEARLIQIQQLYDSADRMLKIIAPVENTLIFFIFLKEGDSEGSVVLRYQYLKWF